MSDLVYFFRMLAVMAIVTYLVRVLPLVLIKRRITNRYLLSFFHYIPYTVLAAMTFPGILYSTGNPYSALAAIVVAVALAFFDRGLLTVSVISTAVALIVGLFFL